MKRGKFCVSCGKSIASWNRSGYCTSCSYKKPKVKAWKKEYSKRYAANNRDKKLLISRKYYQEHKLDLNKKAKEYYQKNKKRLQLIAKENYRKKHLKTKIN